MEAFLNFLLFAPQRQREIIVQTLTDEQLKLVMEIIYNVANDVIEIPKSDKTLLSRYKLGIRRTLVNGISKRKRRHRLVLVSKLLPIFIRNYLKWREN